MQDKAKAILDTYKNTKSIEKTTTTLVGFGTNKYTWKSYIKQLVEKDNDCKERQFDSMKNKKRNCMVALQHP